MSDVDPQAPQSAPGRQNQYSRRARSTPTTAAMATPAYGAALVVSLIAGLAVAAGVKFGLGFPGVVTAVIAVAVFLPVMAGVLLFNLATKPDVARRLGSSAYWILNAYGVLSLAVAVLTIASAFFGRPVNLRDEIVKPIVKPIEMRVTRLPGEMTSSVYDVYERAIQAYPSDKGESLRLFSEALQQDPDNYILLANRASVYLALGRNTEAITDAQTAQNAYEKLGKQQLRREKAYGLILDNTLINAYSQDRKFAEAETIYDNATPDIADVADTITRIYFSAANAAFAQQKWQNARDTFYKVQAMARVLKNYELEVKTYLNIANAAYWLDPGAIRKSMTELDEGLQAIALYQFSDDDKILWSAQFHNAKGLALFKLHSTGADNSSLSQIVVEYQAGRGPLEQRVVSSDEAQRVYADLSGNLADVYRAQQQYDEAEKDYQRALGIFMKLGDRNGISRQAYGLGSLFLDARFPRRDNETSLACALVAIKLGPEKPAAQKSEDQQLLADASKHLNETERAAVEQQLAVVASKAFGISVERMRLYLR